MSIVSLELRGSVEDAGQGLVVVGVQIALRLLGQVADAEFVLGNGPIQPLDALVKT